MSEGFKLVYFRDPPYRKGERVTHDVLRQLPPDDEGLVMAFKGDCEVVDIQTEDYGRKVKVYFRQV